MVVDRAGRAGQPEESRSWSSCSSYHCYPAILLVGMAVVACLMLLYVSETAVQLGGGRNEPILTPLTRTPLPTASASEQAGTAQSSFGAFPADTLPAAGNGAGTTAGESGNHPELPSAARRVKRRKRRKRRKRAKRVKRVKRVKGVKRRRDEIHDTAPVGGESRESPPNGRDRASFGRAEQRAKRLEGLDAKAAEEGMARRPFNPFEPVLSPDHPCANFSYSFPPVAPQDRMRLRFQGDSSALQRMTGLPRGKDCRVEEAAAQLSGPISTPLTQMRSPHWMGPMHALEAPRVWKGLTL